MKEEVTNTESNRLQYGRAISLISLALILSTNFSQAAPAFETGEPASLVIGQSSFTSNLCAATRNGLCGPQFLAFDSRGDLWVSDYINNRVLKFTPPFSNSESASLVIGQSSFTTTTCFGGFSPIFGTLNGVPTQNGLCGPAGLGFDRFGNLWVADVQNSRVLEFTPPFSNGEDASRVIGQPNFATNMCAGSLGFPTRSGLCDSSGIGFDSSGDLWVSDAFNNRILEFAPPFSNGEIASLVIGQPDFATNACSGIGFESSGGIALTQSGLCNPAGLGFDSSGDLWVADVPNSRVLEFTPPFSNGENASLVIGQPNFTTNTTCNPRTTTVPAPTQDGLCFTSDLAFDLKGNLWISDIGNSRVLEFTPPFSNGQNASVAIGQPNFATDDTCIYNSTPLSGPTQSSLCFPLGIRIDSKGNLWVVEYGFDGTGRVLEFAKMHRGSLVRH